MTSWEELVVGTGAIILFGLWIYVKEKERELDDE